MRKRRTVFVVTLILTILGSVVFVNADDEANWSYSFKDKKNVDADITFSGHVGYDNNILLKPDIITCSGNVDGNDKGQVISSNAAVITVINGNNDKKIVNKLIYVDHELSNCNKYTYAGWVQAKWSLFSFNGSRVMQ